MITTIVTGMPEVIITPGLSYERQVYLRKEMREFRRPGTEDVFPKSSETVEEISIKMGKQRKPADFFAKELTTMTIGEGCLTSCQL